MKTQRRVYPLVIGLSLAIGLAIVASGATLSAQRPNDVGTFMRAKLEHSKKLLEGLALEDFDLIAQQSQDLSLLSQATNWQVLNTAEYLEQSAEFRRTADALTQAAKEKNLDGAALRYVDLTMKCVNCHKYVRKVRLAAAPGDASAAEGLAINGSPIR